MTSPDLAEAINPLTPEGGDISGMTINVTMHKQAEVVIQETNHKLQALIQASPLAIIALDSDGRVTVWNSAAERIFGWNEKEVLGYHLPIVPGNKQEAFLTLCNRALSGESFMGVEVYQQKRDGSLIDISISAAPVRNAQGDIKAVVGVAEDITERKRTQAAEKLLLHLQVTAMSSMAHAVFITDSNGRITWVNKAFTGLCGYSAEEVYGQTPGLLKSGKQDALFYQSIWQAILSGEVWRGEIVNRRKDGGLYTVQQTITPLRDVQGKVVHFVAVHEDITDKKQSEAHIYYKAHYDTLTNLPNRSLFYDRLQHELAHAHRNERMLAVMFLDLDRFKVINDTLGHTCGDQALKAVAERLKGCVRESDTVSRWGGDEFIFIITNIIQPQDVAFIAHKIFNEMSSPFQLEERKVYITPTIGIAVYPLDACDGETLIKKADTAMYNGKEGGRNTFKFYTQERKES
jgi:diguanylate cyclase (GGDEF)-like protein/PAS domain S-box-containing protein